MAAFPGCRGDAVMVIVCSYCNARLGTRDPLRARPDVSHGICRSCLEEHFDLGDGLGVAEGDEDDDDTGAGNSAS